MDTNLVSTNHFNIKSLPFCQYLPKLFQKYYQELDRKQKEKEELDASNTGIVENGAPNATLINSSNKETKMFSTSEVRLFFSSNMIEGVGAIKC